MTFDKIAAILAEELDKDISAITPASTFTDLGLDSLDTMELVMKLEDEFSVSIELDPSITCVADLVAVIDKAK